LGDKWTVRGSNYTLNIEEKQVNADENLALAA